MDGGISPPWCSTTARAIPSNDFALLWKNPVGRISASSTAGLAAASARACGNRSKSAGVTMLTRASVHCAERIVATSNSYGFEKSSSQVASGYAAASPASIAAERAGDVGVPFGLRLKVRRPSRPGPETDATAWRSRGRRRSPCGALPPPKGLWP